MKKQVKVKEIQKILDKKYPNPPVPLNHKDPFTLLIAVLLSLLRNIEPEVVFYLLL